MTLTKIILESPYNNCKNCVKELSLTTRTVFNGRSILGYFYRLNCLNFRLILNKIEKLHFLESTVKVSKHVKNDIRATSQ